MQMVIQELSGMLLRFSDAVSEFKSTAKNELLIVSRTEYQATEKINDLQVALPTLDGKATLIMNSVIKLLQLPDQSITIEIVDINVSLNQFANPSVKDILYKMYAAANLPDAIQQGFITAIKDLVNNLYHKVDWMTYRQVCRQFPISFRFCFLQPILLSPKLSDNNNNNDNLFEKLQRQLLNDIISDLYKTNFPEANDIEKLNSEVEFDKQEDSDSCELFKTAFYNDTPIFISDKFQVLLAANNDLYQNHAMSFSIEKTLDEIINDAIKNYTDGLIDFIRIGEDPKSQFLYKLLKLKSDKEKFTHIHESINNLNIHPLLKLVLIAYAHQKGFANFMPRALNNWCLALELYPTQQKPIIRFKAIDDENVLIEEYTEIHGCADKDPEKIISCSNEPLFICVTRSKLSLHSNLKITKKTTGLAYLNRSAPTELKQKLNQFYLTENKDLANALINGIHAEVTQLLQSFSQIVTKPNSINLSKKINLLQDLYQTLSNQFSQTPFGNYSSVLINAISQNKDDSILVMNPFASNDAAVLAKNMIIKINELENNKKDKVMEAFNEIISQRITFLIQQLSLHKATKEDYATYYSLFSNSYQRLFLNLIERASSKWFENEKTQLFRFLANFPQTDGFRQGIILAYEEMMQLIISITESAIISDQAEKIKHPFIVTLRVPDFANNIFEYVLNENVTRTLIDKQSGDIINMETSGQHNIGFYQGLHFKQEVEESGKVFSASHLRALTIGGGYTPNALATFTIKNNRNEVVKSYYVLISRTINGITAAKALTESAQLSFAEEGIIALQEVALFDMNAFPGDASPENHIFSFNQANKITDITSIDDEQYYMPPETKTAEGKVKLLLRDILFTFNESKTEPLRTVVIENWQRINPLLLLQRWLTDCKAREEAYSKLADDAFISAMYNKDPEHKITPFILIPEGMTTRLALNFLATTALSEKISQHKWSITQVLQQLLPRVSNYYAQVINKLITPIERYQQVCQQAYLSVTSSRQSMQLSLGIIPTENEVRQRKKYSPEAALKELAALKSTELSQQILLYQDKQGLFNVKTDFKVLTDETGEPNVWLQKIILTILLDYRFASLDLSYCKILDDKLLIDFLRINPNLKLLNVSHCSNITEVSIRYAADHCKKLEILYLDHTNVKELTGSKMPAELYLYLPAVKKLPISTNLEMSKLKVLHVKDCRNLKLIALNAPLEELNTQNCIILEDLILSKKKIEKINLNDCHKLPFYKKLFYSFLGKYNFIVPNNLPENFLGFLDPVAQEVLPSFKPELKPDQIIKCIYEALNFVINDQEFVNSLAMFQHYINVNNVQHFVDTSPTISIFTKYKTFLFGEELFKEWEREYSIKELPDDNTWDYGETINDNDSFYAAIVQSLTYMLGDDNFQTIKSLRTICSAYMQQLDKDFPRDNWIKQVINNNTKYNTHLAMVQYTQEEITKYKYENNMMIDNPVYDALDIERLILAQELNLTFHIIEFSDVSHFSKSPPPIHMIVTKDEVKQIEKQDIDYQDKQTIHLAVYKNHSHYVPILPKEYLVKQYRAYQAYWRKYPEHNKRYENLLDKLLSGFITCDPPQSQTEALWEFESLDSYSLSSSMLEIICNKLAKENKYSHSHSRYDKPAVRGFIFSGITMLTKHGHANIGAASTVLIEIIKKKNYEEMALYTLVRLALVAPAMSTISEPYLTFIWKEWEQVKNRINLSKDYEDYPLQNAIMYFAISKLLGRTTLDSFYKYKATNVALFILFKNFSKLELRRRSKDSANLLMLLNDIKFEELDFRELRKYAEFSLAVITITEFKKVLLEMIEAKIGENNQKIIVSMLKIILKLHLQLSLKKYSKQIKNEDAKKLQNQGLFKKEKSLQPNFSNNSNLHNVNTSEHSATTSLVPDLQLSLEKYSKQIKNEDVKKLQNQGLFKKEKVLQPNFSINSNLHNVNTSEPSATTSLVPVEPLLGLPISNTNQIVPEEKFKIKSSKEEMTPEEMRQAEAQAQQLRDTRADADLELALAISLQEDGQEIIFKR